jgi:hypothetical protein
MFSKSKSKMHILVFMGVTMIWNGKSCIPLAALHSNNCAMLKRNAATFRDGFEPKRVLHSNDCTVLK